MKKTRILCAAATLAALTSAAPADLDQVVIQDITGAVAPPPGLRTWQVVARMTDPTDEVLAVLGEPGLAEIEFVTNDPAGLRNDPASPFAGSCDEDINQEPFAAGWDSHVSIGFTSAFTRSTQFTFGFAGGGCPAITGTSFTETNGGWYHDPSQPAVTGTEVIIAVFTLAANAEFSFRGGLAWRPAGFPSFATTAFEVSNIGAGACCLSPTLCFVTDEDGCMSLGGTFLGLGSACATQSVTAPCHPGDSASHCVATIVTCPGAGGGGPGPACTPGPKIDAWKTEGAPASFHDFGAAGQAIPADFFGPGSDPFTSQVPLSSVPLGVVDLTGVGGGVVDVGDADTLVLRSADPFDRCDLPSATPVSVSTEIVALRLASADPIVVTFNGGQDPELWDVDVDLSTVPGAVGTLTATKTHCNGGTYEVSLLSVQPRFTFTKVSDPGRIIVLDTGVEGVAPIALTLANADWVHDPTGLDTLAPYCTDFHPGLLDPQPTTDCDCNTNGVRDLCDIEDATSDDCNGDDIPDECQALPPCPEDIDCDFAVGFSDLLEVLTNWGPCAGCPQDIDLDGNVGFSDVLAVLTGWGPC